MANTDNEGPVVSESFPKEGHASNHISIGPVLTEDSSSIQDVSASKSPANPSPEPPAGEPNTSKESFTAKPTAGPNGDASSALNSSRPTLTQLPSNGTTAAPLPKRFSAVNISKKFLEKNSSPATNSMASSSSSQAKSGGSAARPSVQSSYPHSKLVTAKLTAAPQPSTTTGPGWSRPSSVAPGLQPTTAPNGVSAQASSSSQLKGPATSTHGPPQLPHAGTVIQPQPRAASQISQTDGMTSGKSVWGNLRSSASLSSGVRAQNEFPTAAEVAQVSRKPKGMDAKEPTEASAAHKQARLEEADTFRGVHLDPNAHHWDEMEEDDDNFLDGVIEFGDGRQYKVDTVETPPTPAANGSGDLSRTSARQHESTSIPIPNFPVRKEERFADDFDRSWPKSSPSLSSTGAPYSGPSGGSIASPTSPGSTIHGSQSGQEGGRVLFNERSNKLEPYSSSHRQGPNSYPSKKGYSDAPVLDAKTSRDASTSSNSNVQLLQKSSERGRAHMGVPGSGSFDRQRDYSRRDGPGIGHVPPSPRSAFSQPGPVNGNEIRGRRMSNMGPPPLPGSVSRDFGQRQSASHYPPHSYNTGQGGIPPRYPQGPPSSSSAASVRHPSQSPVLSHASSTVVLPNVEATAAQLIGPDIDELRKDVMQNAAARAKQRRQQEEEEREKEKERARRKAAELANEIKPKTVSEPIKEQEVIAVIEDAIRSVDTVAPSTDPTKPSTSEKTQLQRPPSLKGHDRTRLPASRRLSIPSSASGPAPAALTTSWRSHATPLPPPPVPPRVAGSRNVQTAQNHSSPFVSALEHVQILAEDPEADLEVVEFSDMGKFVGVPDSLEPKNDQSRPPPSKPSRPVASDFFDGPSDWDTPPMADVDTWRRKGSQEEKDAKDAAGSSTHPRPPTPTPTTQQVHPAPPEITPSTESVSAQASPSRPSKYQSTYNQATMLALDDAMSRIKGALDVMQASDKDVSVQPPLEPGTETEPKRPSPPARATSPSSSKTVKERWLPPALRLRHLDVETREIFHSTAPEPPRSPKPVWNTFTVKLPKTSIAREAISKKQLAQLNRVFPVRWDILSFDPPVEGMSRRDFTVIDVLYRKPSYKGKNTKFRVALPRAGAHLQMSRENSSHLGLKGNGAGAFGKPTMADGASTWRKPGSSPLPTNAPPEPSIVPQSEPPLANSSAHAPSSVKGDIPRTKSQPKMPAGTSVAFYRDSQVVDADIDVKPLVNFIVTSELEEPRLSPKDSAMTGTARAPSNPSNDSRPDGLKTASVEQHIPRTDPAPTSSSSLIQTGKSSEDSSEPPPIVPPSQSSNTWSRPSLNMSGRGPDPEHLKAVWLQTSNMAELHPVNSLEGIADDPVPFTLQDVKSEDGATPPPTTSSGPSRMSLHDVTRAFQQVPSTSGSTNHKLTISPPTTSAPVARPAPNFGYAIPLPTSNQNMRAPYPPYGSPMMSHSPAPVVYPHPITNSPVPSRMQVSGQYGQPAVWMPLPPPATTQAHGAMMRPVPSPYTPQLMPMAYSPNAQPMYLPAVPNMQSPPQQNSASNRGRTMSMMMSPGIPHASPNMYGSPVMMASPARNQMRNDNSQAHPPPTHHPPTSAYVPAPSTSFMRQW